MYQTTFLSDHDVRGDIAARRGAVLACAVTESATAFLAADGASRELLDVMLLLVESLQRLCGCLELISIAVGA